MKRMTKVWGMLCLAGLLISLYLGVSFLVPKQGKIILTFGMFSGNQSDVPNDDCYKIIDETIKEFEKEYPNVKVKYTSGILKEDYSEWLSNQALNGALPDVFMVLPEDFTTFASIGILKNLETMLKADASLKKDAFYQGCYDAGTYKGNQYALPYESVPSLMLVNETLLEKNNISLPDNRWTWNDFYNICKKITKDTNDDGKTDQFGVYDYSWIDAIYSNGGGIFNGSGTSCNITNPSVEDAILFARNIYQLSGRQSPTSEDFDKGNIAFRPVTFSEFRTYKPYPWRIKKYSGFEWTCIRMPAGPSGDNRSEMSALMAGMSSRTEKKQCAWDFVKLLTTDTDIQKLVYEDTSAASVLKSVNTSQDTMNLLNKDTPGDSIIDMSLLDTAIDAGVIPNRFEQYEEAYEKTDSLIKSYVDEEGDSSTFLFQMKNQIDKILKK